MVYVEQVTIEMASKRASKRTHPSEDATRRRKSRIAEKRMKVIMTIGFYAGY